LQVVIDETLKYPLKYENRDMLNTLVTQNSHADDILIVQDTKVTDTSIANVAFYDGTSWFTPKTPLLHGTTRARLLDEGKLITKDIFLDSLQNYTKIAIMNAMIGFVEIENGILPPK